MLEGLLRPLLESNHSGTHQRGVASSLRSHGEEVCRRGRDGIEVSSSHFLTSEAVVEVGRGAKE